MSNILFRYVDILKTILKTQLKHQNCHPMLHFLTLVLKSSHKFHTLTPPVTLQHPPKPFNLKMKAAGSENFETNSSHNTVLKHRTQSFGMRKLF